MFHIDSIASVLMGLRLRSFSFWKLTYTNERLDKALQMYLEDN